MHVSGNRMHSYIWMDIEFGWYIVKRCLGPPGNQISNSHNTYYVKFYIWMQQMNSCRVFMVRRYNDGKNLKERHHGLLPILP